MFNLFNTDQVHWLQSRDTETPDVCMYCMHIVLCACIVCILYCIVCMYCMHIVLYSVHVLFACIVCILYCIVCKLNTYACIFAYNSDLSHCYGERLVRILQLVLSPTAIIITYDQ